MKPSNILIIGGSGFLGSHIVARLAAAGAAIRVPTRNRERVKDELILLPTAEVVRADVHDPATLRGLMVGMDAVVSLVGVLHDRRGDGFRRDHVELPAQIVAACAEAGVHRIVHVSALGAAADAPSAYLRSKALGEAEIRAGDNMNIRTTTLRPSVIFGRGDGFLNLFADLVRLFPILPLGGARARFQPVFVEDVAKVVVACLDLPETNDQCYELCGPTVYTLQELVAYVCALLGRRRLIVPLPESMAMLQAVLLEHLPGHVMSRDNVLSMRVPNIASTPGAPLPAVFGFPPTPLEAVAPEYLAARTPRARYRGFRFRAGR